jgi:hypothetical protein
MKPTTQTDRPQKATGRRGVAALLAALAVLLVACAMVIYAAVFHKLPVLMEQKVDTGAGSAQADWFSEAPGPGRPQAPGPVEVITLEESEPELVHEVSFGGVARSPEGEVKRTYSGKPPSLCPT